MNFEILEFVDILYIQKYCNNVSVSGWNMVLEILA